MGGGGDEQRPILLVREPQKTGVRKAYGRDARSKPTLVGYNSRLDIGALMTESRWDWYLDFLLYVLFLEAVKYVLYV
jgi:hypothetical protein